MCIKIVLLHVRLFLVDTVNLICVSKIVLLHVRLFLVDTVNFCFWSDNDILFTVDYNGKLWTGYRALRAALLRAMEVSEISCYIKPSVF